MRKLLLTLVLCIHVSHAMDKADISGIYQDITDSEYYQAIELLPDGSCESTSGVYAFKDCDAEREEKYRCKWDVENNHVVIKYKSGVIEKLKFARNESLSNFGYEGKAKGLMPIENEKYPITFGAYLWSLESLKCDINDTSFNAFFEKFRINKEFQFSRTIYPLRELLFSNNESEAIPDRELQSLHKRILGKEELWVSEIRTLIKRTVLESPPYFPHDSVMSGNEVEGVETISEDEGISYIDRSGKRLIIIKYKNINGCWYAYEFSSIW